jgi:protein disulfide-isomerase A6
MRALQLLLAALLIISASAFYDRYSAVQSLTASDFQQVKKGIWLVEFYAEWCGHCRNLAPEYEKAAKALKGIANIAAIDADKQRTDVQVQGFPTIKFFVDGKMSDYDGARTADGIVDFMFRKLRNIANEKLGGGGAGGHTGSHSSGASGNADEKDVIILSDNTFEASVYGD